MFVFLSLQNGIARAFYLVFNGIERDKELTLTYYSKNPRRIVLLSPLQFLMIHFRCDFAWKRSLRFRVQRVVLIVCNVVFL